MTRGGALPTPSLILAADHRARAVLTTENWAEFVGALPLAVVSTLHTWPGTGPPDAVRR